MCLWSIIWESQTLGFGFTNGLYQNYGRKQNKRVRYIFVFLRKQNRKKNSYFGKKRYYIVNIFACIWNLYHRYILNDQIKGRYNLCCIWEDFFLSSVGIKNVKILISLYVSSYSMKMNRRVSYLNASPQQWKWNES